MLRLIAPVALAFFTSAAAFAAEEWKPIWNGKNLEEWTVWLKHPEPTSNVPGLAKNAAGKYTEPLGARDPLKVFSVVEHEGKPVIRVSGEVFGELRSRGAFENYHLRFQFKWGQKKWPPRDKPETPRDSGLLYHVHAEPGAEGRVWARSTELQIQERDTGDLYSVGSIVLVRAALRKGTGNATTKAIFDYDPKSPWRPFDQLPGSDGRCVKQPDNEKPTGEWNTIELVCVGEDSYHIVNGKVVMRLHRTMRVDTPTPQVVTSGPIILQSEGAELFYRDIAVRSIRAVPREFAEQ
ncbi:MAG: DUF1080 domain-containing protein [Verrucomicrobiota bacterium]